MRGKAWGRAHATVCSPLFGHCGGGSCSTNTQPKQARQDDVMMKVIVQEKGKSVSIIKNIRSSILERICFFFLSS